jgi:hypothetical protein
MRKTDITMVVYNPTTNTYKSGVVIEITEYRNKHIGTLVGARIWRREGIVATAITDGNGTAVISGLKLKKERNVKYYCTPIAPVYASYLAVILKVGKENNITFDADW